MEAAGARGADGLLEERRAAVAALGEELGAPGQDRAAARRDDRPHPGEERVLGADRVRRAEARGAAALEARAQHAAGVPRDEHVAAGPDRGGDPADPAGGEPPRCAEAVPGAAQRHVDAVGARPAVLEPRERSVAARVGGERHAHDPHTAPPHEAGLAERPVGVPEAHEQPRRVAAGRAQRGEEGAAAPVGRHGLRLGGKRPRGAEGGGARRPRGRVDARARRVADPGLEAPARERAPRSRDGEPRLLDERVRARQALRRRPGGRGGGPGERERHGGGDEDQAHCH